MSPELLLFSAGLGLPAPWEVHRADFTVESQELHLYLDFQAGGRFSCPDCGQSCPAYDTEPDRVWRHLDFFQHKTFLHARFPRVQCPACGVKTPEAPWARSGSGFTLLFEAYALLLAKQMSVLAAGRHLDEHDTRLWRLIEHHVEAARAEEEWSGVTQVGLDETACKRGHDYISVFADPKTGKVLFATPGKDAGAVAAFREAFVEHGGDPSRIAAVSLDMSPAFGSGVAAQFPRALPVFDRFHVMKVVNHALDLTRREEAKGNESLKRTRYLWLKNPEQRSEREEAHLQRLLEQEGATVQAYRMKVRFQELWTQSNPETAQTFLEEWLQQAEECGLPLQKAAQTIRSHAQGVLNYFKVEVTNGLLEGLNSLLQTAKRKARGYRNPQTFILITYLLTGKLDFGLPTLNSE
jgi:transposase